MRAYYQHARGIREFAFGSFTVSRSPGLTWLRVGDWRLSLRHRSQFRFSHRSRYARGWYVGPWFLAWRRD